jgi:hypothetical protein
MKAPAPVDAAQLRDLSLQVRASEGGGGG